MSTIEHLSRFYNAMQQAYTQSKLSFCEQHEMILNMAGRGVHMAMAGNRLSAIVCPAFAHLQQYLPPNRIALELFIWDEASTKVLLPQLPWNASVAQSNAHLIFPERESYKITFTENGEILTIIDCVTNKAFIWIKDAASLLTYFYAAPFMHFFNSWFVGNGLALVHAGCVGDEHGAVLLVGKGGSGKSTTSLLSALAGLYYLGDDYTLVSFGNTLAAHCLYSTGKLHQGHLERFPQLAKLAVNPKTGDMQQKPVIFMHRHFASQIATERKLKAIVAPVVTGKKDSSLHKVSAADSLKSLAVSTILQLKTDDLSFLKKMSGLARTLPGYRLELGTDTAQIAPIIQELLKTLP